MTNTIAYAMSDLGPAADGSIAAGTVSVPETKGGCGKQHTVFLNEDGRPCIECTECAPVLIGSHYGWASSPAGVPLTPDELGEVQIAEREGQVAMRMAMKAMGDTVGKMVQQDTPKLSASTLAAQLASMSAAERAEIAKLLAPDTPALPKPHLDTPAKGQPILPPAKTFPAKPPAARGKTA